MAQSHKVAGLEAVVMAAGEGRRLRPLTERWPKPVLPIDGRPVAGTLLRALAEAGIARATVVTGHLAEQVEALLGDIGAFGLEARFVRQPRADGSADAVSRALAAGAATPAIVVAADTVFADGDLRLFAETYLASAAGGALATRLDPPPGGPGRPATRVANGRVVTVIDDDPSNPLAAAPLWGLGPQIVPFLEDLPGPSYELAVAFQRAIDAGITVKAIEIAPTRDLTDPLDLVEQNFPYLRTT